MGLARSVLRSKARRNMGQAKRAARKVRFPRGFQGAVMWCPKCYAELARLPDGEPAPSKFEQQQIVDAHRAVCKAA